MQINPFIPSVETGPTLLQFTDKSEHIQPKPAEDRSTENSSTEKQPSQPEKLAKLQNVLSENNISLKFRQDDKTHAVIVELVDSQTGEAIRQIPTEVSIKLAAAFTKLQGQFVDGQG